MPNSYNYSDSTASTYRSPTFYSSYPFGNSTSKSVDSFKLTFVPRFSVTGSLSSPETSDALAQRVNLIDSVGLMADIDSVINRLASSGFTGANTAAKEARRNTAAINAKYLLLGFANALLADTGALDSLGSATSATVCTQVVDLIDAATLT